MNWFAPSWNENSNKTEATKMYMVLRCHSHGGKTARLFKEMPSWSGSKHARPICQKEWHHFMWKHLKNFPDSQQTYAPFWPPTVPNVYFQNEFFCFPAKGWVRLSSTGEFSFFDRSDRCVAYKSFASHVWSFLDDSPLNFEVNIKYCFT